MCEFTYVKKIKNSKLVLRKDDIELMVEKIDTNPTNRTHSLVIEWLINLWSA